MLRSWSARRWTWAALLVGVIVIASSGIDGATAALHNPQPADASGDPSDTFGMNDSLWAYATADLKGGYICVVPAEGDLTQLSCDSPARDMGTATRIASDIGTVFTLVKNAPLHEGSYRLLVEDSDHTPLETSIPFTVAGCNGDCDTSPDAAIVDAFKAAARDMATRMGGMCAMHGILEKIAGKAIDMRGIDKSIKLPTIPEPLQPLMPGFALELSGAGFEVEDPATYGINKALDIYKEVSCGAKEMYHDMAADPADPNYQQVAPPQPNDIATLTPASLDAATRSTDAQRAYVEAARIAFERYQGAAAANDVQWEITQLHAAADNAWNLALELGGTTSAMSAWADDAANDPSLAGSMLTAANEPALAAAYARVRDTGFTFDEIAQFHALGYTDDDIAAIRTHADVDLGSIPLDTTYADAVHAIASQMDDGAQAIGDFASEADAVASQLSASLPTNHDPTAVDDTLSVATGATWTVNALANDTDVDGDPLSVTGSTNGAHGAVSCEATGTCSYKADAGYVGADSFTYTISDGRGGTATGAVTVSVVADQPPVAAADAVSVRQDLSVNFNVTKNDSDANGDPIKLVDWTSPGHGSVSCDEAGDCLYAPDGGYVGPDSFTYTISDGLGLTDTATVTITVNAEVAPVGVDDTLVLQKDSMGAIDVVKNDTDANGDTLSLVSAGDPAHGSVACARQITTTTTIDCVYTPNSGYVGDDAFAYEISDGLLTSDATVTVHVEASAPVIPLTLYVGYADDLRPDPAAFPIPWAGSPNVVFSGQSGGQWDSGAVRLDNPGGSPVQVQDLYVTLPGTQRGLLAGFEFALWTPLTLDPGKIAIYADPGGLAFDTSDATGADPCAPLGPGTEPLVTVTLGGVAYSFEDSGRVLDTGGIDVGTCTGNESHGWAQIGKTTTSTTASLSLIPAAQTADTGSQTTVTGRLVDSAGDPIPGVEVDFSISAGPDAGKTGSGVTDAAGDAAFSFTGDTLGTDTVDASVTTLGGTFSSSNAASVTWVAPTNHAPVAADQSATTNENTALQVTLGATDADNDPLTFTIVSGPGHGSLGTVSGTKVTYTPTAGYSGPDSFTFKANDGTTDSNTATVTLTVNHVVLSSSTSYTGGQTVQYSDPVTLSGKVTSGSPAAGLSGKELDFTLGGQAASAKPTAADGTASTSLVVTQQPGSVTNVHASFAGDADYGSSSTTASFTIAKEDCIIAYSGDLDVLPLASTTLAADIGEPDSSPGDRSHKTVTFTVMGTASSTPQVLTATTDAAGHAALLVPLISDVYAVSVSFAGDGFYNGCASSQDAVVTVEAATAKVTGGGWISNGTGRTSFGFNAIPQAGGAWSGQFQLRSNSNKNQFHGNVVTRLTTSNNTATWTGTGSWNGQTGFTYTITAVDNGASGAKKGDTVSIAVTSSGGTTVFSTGGPQPLKGGNVTVHR